MAEIRNDIFPNMVPYIGDKERFFERLNIPKENQEAFLNDYIKKDRQRSLRVFVNEAYQGMTSQFQSELEFIDYINSFVDTATAELFIDVCKFYFSSKQDKLSTIKLIMIFSIIEKINVKRKKWMEFANWILSRKQRPLIQENIDAYLQAHIRKAEGLDKQAFQDIAKKMHEKYKAEYGSQRNVFDFFNYYVSKENQFKLIKSFRANYTKVIDQIVPNQWNAETTIEKASQITKIPIEKRLMPYCFNWKKCEVNYGDCDYSETCELNNKLILEQALKKVVNDIYQIRNDFVHSASITTLGEYESSDAKDSFSLVLGAIGSDDKPIAIEMTMKEFENIFEESLKKYFDAYQNSKI
jgi:hypothetical protein